MSLTKINEDVILNCLISDLLAAGFELTVHDGEEETVKRSTDAAAIRAALQTTDVDRLYVHHKGALRPFSFVYLIYGNGNNGLDVISDYGLLLEPIIKPIFKMTEEIETNGSIPPVYAEGPALLAVLEKLANAADAVGVKFFDTDDLGSEVLAMQQATLDAREIIARAKGGA